jgi:hypothetical protein
MSKLIDIDYTWFKSPVICCKKGLEDIGYLNGTCKVSEDVSKQIINWPCAVEEGWESDLLNFFGKISKT